MMTKKVAADVKTHANLTDETEVNLVSRWGVEGSRRMDVALFEPFLQLHQSHFVCLSLKHLVVHS